MDTINFRDLGTNSAAFMAIRRLDESLAIGIGVGIEVNGDLDLVVSLG